MPVTYKCPNCGAAMEFDSTLGALKCAGCGESITVEEYQKNYGSLYERDEQEEQMSSQNDEGAEGTQNFAGNMKVFHCQSCGAELVADEYTSATICSFCGNPSLVEERLQGAFQPKLVIPFKINREQAKNIYRGWVKKGLLTPRSLATSATIEKITGVYVPFWLYDFNAETQMHANAEKVRTERHGDTEYIHTDHYKVYRDVEADFIKVPADASEKMDDSTMDKLEPFNYGEIVPFSMPYLSGYFSEKYNYTADDMRNRVEKRINNYITNIARSTMNQYSSVSVVSNDVSLHGKGSSYALLPVWMLNYRFQGKEFQFVLNGQTGKIVANRPVSRQRAVAAGFLTFAVTFIITMLGGLL